MLEFAKNPGLLVDSTNRVVVIFRNFDGDTLISFDVPPQMDVGEGSLAQFLLDFVRSVSGCVLCLVLDCHLFVKLLLEVNLILLLKQRKTDTSCLRHWLMHDLIIYIRH